jgi:hypothetical protein
VSNSPYRRIAIHAVTASVTRPNASAAECVAPHR